LCGYGPRASFDERSQQVLAVCSTTPLYVARQYERPNENKMRFSEANAAPWRRDRTPPYVPGIYQSIQRFGSKRDRREISPKSEDLPAKWETPEKGRGLRIRYVDHPIQREDCQVLGEQSTALRQLHNLRC